MDNLSTEQLIQLATEQSSLEIKQRKELDSSVVRFIRENNISVGINKIPTFYLYYIYKVTWKRDSRKLTKVEFFRQFSKEFESYRSGKQRYYMLEGITMTKEINEKAQKYAMNKQENSHVKKSRKKIKE